MIPYLISILKYLICILMGWMITGCGAFQITPTSIGGEGSPITDREGAYYLAQRDAAIATAQAAAAPIFVLEAAPGQTLRIEGLERIAVRAPGTGQGSGVQQYENPWADVTGRVLGSVLPLAVGQWGAYEIVKSLGETSQAVTGTVAALGSQGFEVTSQSGQQTAEVAIHGMDQIAAGAVQVGNTAQAGFNEIGDTAQAGISATAATGQAGIAGVQGTADAGFGAVTDTAALSIGALQSLGTPPPAIP